MDINRLCMGCMHEMEEDYDYCPECGYKAGALNSSRGLQPQTILNGKYLVGKVIGEGGFGITYISYDLVLNNRVAIKEYFPSELVTRDTSNGIQTSLTVLTGSKEEQYKKGIERFIREAGNLARFNNLAGIVSVKEFFYENNTAYMVMEYIDGVTLSKYLNDNGGKLPYTKVLEMMSPVMESLEKVHEAGIVHRDISPDNIMVTQDGRVKLIDFGAARIVGNNDVKSLTVILKHGYAPEEQYQPDGKQGPWTDVYALAATMYRMITGEVPQESTDRVLNADKVEAVNKKVADVPRKVSDAIMHGLAVKISNRPQRISDFRMELENGKTKKWSLIVGGFAGVAVIAALIIGIVFSIIPRREEADLPIANETEMTPHEDEDDKFEQSSEAVAIGTENQEDETPEAELEEPENIRALREYYNGNELWRFGRPLFIDMTGDGEDEMIVAEEKQEQTEYGITVYGYNNNNIEAIYRSNDTSGIYYFLSVLGDDKYIIKMNVTVTTVFRGGSTMDTYEGSDETIDIFYEKISLIDAETESVNEREYSDEEMESLITKSILLTCESGGALLWEDAEKLADYQSILEQKEVLGEVFKIAESVQTTVKDYAAVYDGEDRCIFAFTGEAPLWRDGPMNGTMDDYFPHSVWAYHDGQLEEVGMFYMDDTSTWYSKIYQFGRAYHFILEIWDWSGWEQIKFCYEEGIAHKIDSSIYFYKVENGKVKMFLGWPSSQGVVDGVLDSGATVDIFYYDHQYVEYGAEVVDVSVLEQYENYREILQEAEENLLKVKDIYIGQDSLPVYERIEKVELDYVRMTVSDTFYLNYRIYGKLEEGYNFSYEDYDYTRAYIVLDTTGNRLEIVGQYNGERGEYKDSGLPIYYGGDRILYVGQ